MTIEADTGYKPGKTMINGTPGYYYSNLNKDLVVRPHQLHLYKCIR